MRVSQKMRLGLSIWRQGYHVAAWRMPGTNPGSLMDVDATIALAKTAERGLFDMVFFADFAAAENVESPIHATTRQNLIVKHDPMILMAALAMVTQRIGLVGTLSTSYHHPFNVARTFASIDAISRGRAGWNLVTSYSPHERANYGIREVQESAARYARANEFVDVVKGLWNSWDADAFVCDQASGLYYDPAKMHVLAHEGPAFQVRGPLDVARSPQGQPVFVTAGDSEGAQEMAAAHADVLYSASRSFSSTQAFYRGVKARLAKYGRTPDQLLIMPAILPIVAPTRQEAQDKLDLVQSLIHPDVGIGLLDKMFGDLRGCDVDAPLPDVSSRQVDWVRSDLAGELLRRARAENLTVRQLYEIVGTGADWHIAMAGTPADVADLMQDWFENEAADGFNVLPAYTPGCAEDFVDLVVPELQRRALFRTEYEGATLRENLGLAASAKSQTHVAQKASELV